MELRCNCSNNLATAGFFQLKWSGQKGKPAITPPQLFRLQESRTKSFANYRVLYTGPDRASFISGKANGHYYYRVLSGNSFANSSNVLKITVAHHSISKAFMFFIAGAIVFICTLVLIIRGNRQANIH